MAKLIIETDNQWTREKIRSTINTEIGLLKKAVEKTQDRLRDFENRYGKLHRESLYGKIDDMELLEWEGEIETLQRLQQKLKSLEEITFEYK
jgi:hypothetical protein